MRPDIVKRFAARSVYPQPAEWTVDVAGDVRMLFPVSPGAHEVSVLVGGMPRTAMRQEGLIEMAAVRDAIVERDGTISIIPKEKK